MYITTSRSYRQILIIVLKVIGVLSIFLVPIALFQVTSASKQHTINRKVQNDQDHTEFQIPKHHLHNLDAPTSNIGQLGELFDVSHRKEDRDNGASILRLKRQADDEQRPSLAQLTAAGTAAGMVFGNEIAAAAQMAASEANNVPGQTSADEDEESGADETPTGQSVDLSALQSLKQVAPQGEPNPVARGESQQAEEADNINLEHMPDSMDSLMRSEQEDMGADQEGSDHVSEQPSASSQVANNQPELTDADEEDIDQDDATNQNPQLTAAHLSGSYLPLQTLDVVQGGPDGVISGINLPPQRLSSAAIDSADDLSAAAGHHYKKKKKKKVKKIIIKKKKKKGKKYKKLKKVKIIKYKKKKVVKKKKKKPMKHHHHHHDHGKYYM